MAHFRLEAAYDDTSRLYYVEVFYPPESTTPRIRTKPRFASKESALEEAMALIEEGLGKPSKPLTPN
jgi:hypothetical protein